MSTRIALSGGMDPIHIGHLQMIQEAWKRYGTVVIILNSDAWLRRKKGYVFMPQEERCTILKAISYVNQVYLNTEEDDADDTVCKPLRNLTWSHQGKMQRLDWFGNGGDRKNDNVPEIKLCQELSIKLAWNLGGEKIVSSSELVRNAMQQLPPKELEEILRNNLSHLSFVIMNNYNKLLIWNGNI